MKRNNSKRYRAIAMDLTLDTSMPKCVHIFVLTSEMFCGQYVTVLAMPAEQIGKKSFQMCNSTGIFMDVSPYTKNHMNFWFGSHLKCIARGYAYTVHNCNYK